jgi:hypothetical protein
MDRLLSAMLPRRVSNHAGIAALVLSSFGYLNYGNRHNCSSSCPDARNVALGLFFVCIDRSLTPWKMVTLSLDSGVQFANWIV